MTLILPGADIRGFYHALAITLPAWAQANASVRCFADTDAHHRGDRNPSASVNLITGAWQCHGCGAHGGPYDAAIAAGHTPRAAIDLMIRHGLIERRAKLFPARALTITANHRPTPVRHPAAEATPALTVTERDIERWQTALSRRPALIARLCSQRGWRYETMRTLQLGYDRGRVTIPIRNAHGTLRGLQRYQPEHTSRPKMLALRGSRHGLIPHPNTEPSQRIVLVEGPPDMIAARSNGLPAIAVPGDHAWKPRWARLLAGRHVTIIMDADDAGRDAAQRIWHDLHDLANTHIIDLAPDRDDGYDLTDWLLDSTGRVPQLTFETG